MPSKTPQYQIPYPLPTDSVSNGAADMRSMAERVEAVIKSVPRGPAGEQGPAGPAGAQGPTGPAGKGPKGDPGERGRDGAPGPAGKDGADSTVPGPKGDPGERGPAGPEGPASTVPGPKGDPGERGPAGEKGDTGDGLQIEGSVDTYADLPAQPVPAGSAYVVTSDRLVYISTGDAWPAEGDGVQIVGAKGDPGERGPAGKDGADSTVPGPKGDPGPAGKDGADSTVPGPKGDPGERGPAGPASTVPGPKGDPGERGPEGPAGPGILATYSPSNWRTASASNQTGVSFGSVTVANPGRAWTPRVFGNFEAGQFTGGLDAKAVIEARIGTTVVARAVGPNTPEWQGLTMVPTTSARFTGSQTVYFYLLNGFGTRTVQVSTFYINAMIDVYAA